MKYMGSKNRLGKDIAPIIQKYLDENPTFKYDEPCVGGANMIDKIKCHTKAGYDNNRFLIALLNNASKNGLDEYPKHISKEHYSDVRDSYNKKDNRYSDDYKGYIGFMGSYNGRFFDGGYSGHEVFEKGKDKPRDFIRQTINNLEKQLENLKGIEFKYSDFRDLKLTDSVIYCDIPYKGTKQYLTSKNFPYEEFYNWCEEMSKNNIVIISEYNMPENRFKCIWEKSIKTNMMDTQGGIRKTNVERLFMVNKE